MTLEELEEQQRLIWAALEQADSANSDSDIPAGTPLTGNSVTSSPMRTETNVLPEETTCSQVAVSEPGPSDDDAQVPRADQSNKTQNSDGELVDLTEEEEPNRVDSKDNAENYPSVSTSEVNQGEPSGNGNSPKVAEVASQNSSPVPDMSKFAAGITPFEFDNMAESTGIYLRIRSVLKNSPRNQQKSKKASF